MKDVFIVTKTKDNVTVHEVGRFETAGEALDCLRGVSGPYDHRFSWELVGEEGYDDGINVTKAFRTFEYENTKNGDIVEWTFRIIHEQQY